ncbi:LysR family transcriptional regulator [Sinorhizobium meliloti]|nr:LysR family transcriptional regulator [Sinorhizobium meliloti]RVM41720.1 LysR family transcriptional regulator [Sinorhizobium meliloti]RVN60866.1 LysR family transcriptional regulator [Sinorhizobium meliloti]
MRATTIPSLNWLRVFEAAARHQSFARAGKELNMSAAAVSQQVLGAGNPSRAPAVRTHGEPHQPDGGGQRFPADCAGVAGRDREQGGGALRAATRRARYAARQPADGHELAAARAGGVRGGELHDPRRPADGRHAS